VRFVACDCRVVEGGAIGVDVGAFGVKNAEI
jgi:hypothetical protein